MIAQELVTMLRYQVQEGALSKFLGGLTKAREFAAGLVSNLRQSSTTASRLMGALGATVRITKNIGVGAAQFGIGLVQGAREAIREHRALQATMKQTAAAAKKAGDAGKDAVDRIKGYMLTAFAMIGVGGIAKASDEWAGIRARVGIELDESQIDYTLKRLYDMAQDAGGEYQATAKVYLPVIRNRKELGVDNEQVLKLTDNIGKLMTIGGGDKTAQAAALTQLGQALGSGVLRGEELNSILEQAPRLAKAVADSFGVPIGKLKELGEKGKLTSKELVNGLLKQSESINEEFAKMPMTFGRAANYIRNSMERIIDKWTRMTNAGLWFNKIVRAIADNLEHILGVGAIAMMAYGMSKLRALTWATVAPMLRLVALAVGLYLVFQDIGVWLRGGDSALGALIGDVSEWQGAIDVIKKAGLWLKELVNDNSKSVEGFGLKWGAIGLVIFALAKPVMFIIGAVGKLVRWALLLGRAFLVVLRVLFVVGRVLLGLASWPAAIVAAVATAAYMIWRNFDEVKTFVIQVWTAVAEFIVQAFSAVSQFLIGLWNHMLSVFMSVVVALTKVFNDLWDGAKSAAIGAFEGVANFFKDVMAAAVDFVANYIPNKLGEVMQSMKGFANGILPESMQFKTDAAAASVGSAPATLKMGAASVNVENNFNVNARSDNARDIAAATKNAVEGPARRSAIESSRRLPNVEVKS